MSSYPSAVRDVGMSRYGPGTMLQVGAASPPLHLQYLSPPSVTERGGADEPMLTLAFPSGVRGELISRHMPLRL